MERSKLSYHDSFVIAPRLHIYLELIRLASYSILNRQSNPSPIAKQFYHTVLVHCLLDTINEMITTIRRDNAAHLTWLQGIGCSLEWFLHVTTPKMTQISVPAVGGTIWPFLSVLWKRIGHAFLLDLSLVLFQFCHSIVWRQRNLLSSPATLVIVDWKATLAYPRWQGLSTNFRATYRRETGLRLPVCLISKWAARTWSDILVAKKKVKCVPALLALLVLKLQR